MTEDDALALKFAVTWYDDENEIVGTAVDAADASEAMRLVVEKYQLRAPDVLMVKRHGIPTRAPRKRWRTDREAREQVEKERREQLRQEKRERHPA